MKAQLPAIVRFGREICGDLSQCERREWWVTNGLGGYAAGTIAGTLTRRYHGLLIAPVNPPLGRYLIFAKADATLMFDGCSVPLFTNRWAGDTVEPQGHVNIESFRLDGRMPTWTYAVGDVRIEARIWMEHGANTTYVAYRLRSGSGRSDMKLSVKLLVSARDHHQSARTGEFNPYIRKEDHRLCVAHPNWFTLYIQPRGGEIAAERTWVENFDYAVERERGLPHLDNHLCVGTALLDLREGEWVGFSASLQENASSYLEEAMRRFQQRDAGLLTSTKVQVPALLDAPQWLDQLLLAADSFLFARPLSDEPNGESVIAGYPWFGDWGRDTMIALPGLTLATGRLDSARRILTTFARFVDRGMLPNVFPGEGGAAEYNTADAALWFIEAWRAFVMPRDDVRALEQVFPVLADVIDWHVKGTRYGIAIDPRDGLLRAGESGVQITWMDAKIGDWVVTPRIGKPVEINALWCNALDAMCQFSGMLQVDESKYRVLRDAARAGFQRFVNPYTGALYDVIDGPNGNDATLRPNQLLAVSLNFSALDADQQARVVTLCGAELATSYGLRSLVPSHPDYKPNYRGGVWERDSAYHQGPVWGWLLGHYAMAYFRVTGDATFAQGLLEPIRDHLLDAGLGTVSEIFDGAPPHQPRGAPAQAWSVACVIEAWWKLELAKHDAPSARGKTVGSPEHKLDQRQLAGIGT